MALEMPPFVAKAGVADAPIKFKWADPWDCRFEVPRLQNQIAPVYARSVMALTAGFAEWVVWRLKAGSTDPIFLQFIEAAWASVVERRYLNHISKAYASRIKKYFSISENALQIDNLWTNDDLQNPSRGPLFVAMRLLGEVADRTTPRGNGAMESVFLSNLVEQITNKSSAFKEWRRFAIKRLQDHYCIKMEDEDLLGPPVPRQVLDPDFEYEPEMAPGLIKTFLESLDYSANPFLVPPNELKKLGFEGKAYSF